MWDPGEYRKGGIRASTGEGSERVPERWDPGKYRKSGIRASTGNVGSGRVSERWDPSKYRKGGIWASIEKSRIQASTGEGSG